MRVRMTVEFDIDENMLSEHKLSADEVLRGVYLRSDDVCDGFQITTNIPGKDCTCDFFLSNGVVVEKSLVKDVLSLDEQISVASASKEYELTLFQGKENEKMIRALLTEEQVLNICKSIGGKSSLGDYIEFPGGERIEICDIDAIETVDGDTLIPNRQATLNNTER